MKRAAKRTFPKSGLRKAGTAFIHSYNGNICDYLLNTDLYFMTVNRPSHLWTSSLSMDTPANVTDVGGTAFPMLFKGSHILEGLSDAEGYPVEIEGSEWYR